MLAQWSFDIRRVLVRKLLNKHVEILHLAMLPTCLLAILHRRDIFELQFLSVWQARNILIMNDYYITIHLWIEIFSGSQYHILLSTLFLNLYNFKTLAIFDEMKDFRYSFFETYISSPFTSLSLAKHTPVLLRFIIQVNHLPNIMPLQFYPRKYF